MSAGIAFQFLSLMTIVTVSFAVDTVEMTVTSQNVKPGTTVNIKCVGIVDSTAIVGPIRQIVKKLTIEEDVVSFTIASNGIVQSQFPNRYLATAPAPSGSNYNFTLTISDIQLEDSGTYSCGFQPSGKDKVETSKLITVLYPAESVELTIPKTTNDQIDVQPNEGVPVKCVVKNYHPKMPSSAKIVVGDKDVTSQFEGEDSENITGNYNPAQQGGLVKVLYTTILEASNFIMLPEYAGKLLKCISSIGDNPTVDSVNIKMKNIKPIIKCPKNVEAKSNTIDGFNITCHVIFTPRVSRRSVVWYWNTTSGNERNATIYKSDGHFAVSTVDYNSDTLVVILTYKGYVRTNHYRPYKLVVKGTTAEAVTLVVNPVPGMVGDNGSSRIAVSFLSIVLCFQILYIFV